MTVVRVYFATVFAFELVDEIDKWRQLETYFQGYSVANLLLRHNGTETLEFACFTNGVTALSVAILVKYLFFFGCSVKFHILGPEDEIRFSLFKARTYITRGMHQSVVVTTVENVS